MPKINGERLLADLNYLRAIGAVDSGVARGVVRPAFSEADMTARRWLAAQYEAAGLEVTLDGVGNVIGRSKNPGPALLVGSHSDTQPTGGWLDGALGVIYGLEAVRALAEDPATRDLALDAVSLQDEESRFFGCLGSRSLCGLFTADMEANAEDKDGVKLADALQAAGLADRPRTRLDPARYVGFLEAHIEQGPRLENEARKIGVVTSIVGLGGRRFLFHGRQNHAGTTMMDIRKDAATALFALAHKINQAFPGVAGEHSVWTMGRAVLHPGATSIIPGYGELDLQYRDKSPEVLAAFADLLPALVAEVNAAGGAQVEMQTSRITIQPAHMDPGLRGHIQTAAEANVPGKWIDMPSGAFHDAGVISAVLPAAMIFIPSIGGISHDFTEDSHDADIVTGGQVLADAAANILAAANGRS